MKPKVLIADPTVDDRSPVIQHLADLGYAVLLASTVRTATCLVDRNDLSFAILELRLEDGDPFDLIKEMRRSSSSVRILIHSTFCNVAVAVRAIKAGANDVLPKPTDPEFLLSLLTGEDIRVCADGPRIPSPETIRRRHIENVHAACNGNTMRAANKLNMNRRTLQRLLVRTSTRVTPRQEITPSDAPVHAGIVSTVFNHL
ncbi:response regulator [Rhizobium laguerreae]|uniref:response regulator transcription factor n=1 Tax=Rhizobium laguerreae TaxID=1076926 RepID=UPI001C927E2D|nr:response regulator [Rhizobium laguerreae]MBY3537565.1 response regulator [Rhizobium laguerreae]